MCCSFAGVVHCIPSDEGCQSMDALHVEVFYRRTEGLPRVRLFWSTRRKQTPEMERARAAFKRGTINFPCPRCYPDGGAATRLWSVWATRTYVRACVRACVRA